MKKLFFLIFLLSFVTLSAQQYRLVHNHLPVYYGEAEVHTFAIDSSVDYTGYTVYYALTSIRDTSVWMDGQCLDAQAGELLGRVLVERATKTSILNFNGDSIHYFPQTIPGERHTFYTLPNGNFLEAEHFQTTFEEVLGVMDSVKYFSLQAYHPEGDSIPNDFNGLVFKLSKNFGLITTIDNYLFPMGSAVTKELSGFSNPATGVKNMVWEDAFNMDKGDEFHISESRYMWEMLDDSVVKVHTVTDIIRLIEAREEYTDSISFTYRECRRIVKSSPLAIDTSYVADTLISEMVKKYPEFEWFDLYPVQYSGEGEYSRISQHISPDFNSRAVKNILFNELEGDSCLTYTIYCPEHTVHHYIDGCGGPYYSSFFGFEMPARKLLYFKKGAETWGIPIAGSCESLVTGTDEPDARQASLLVYPNPFDSQFTISSESGLIQQLRIFTISGKLLTTIKVETQTALVNTSHFSTGIYLIQIQMVDGRVFWKKMVKD